MGRGVVLAIMMLMLTGCQHQQTAQPPLGRQALPIISYKPATMYVRIGPFKRWIKRRS